MHAAIDDLRFVLKAVHSLSAQWENIGLNLRVAGLEDIRKNFPGDTLKCLIAVLSNYLQQQYDTERDIVLPCWKRILEAVAAPVGGENPRKAEEIAKNYGSRLTDSEYTVIFLSVLTQCTPHRLSEVQSSPCGKRC